MFDPDTHMLFDIDLAKRSLTKTRLLCAVCPCGITSIFKTASERAWFRYRLHGTSQHGRGEESGQAGEHVPRVLDSIVLDYRTNRLTSYLEDLSKVFHAYYNKYIVVDPGNGISSGPGLRCANR